MKANSLLAVSLAGLCLATVGCSRWYQVEADSVWVAPGRKAVEQRKNYSDWNAGSLYHMRWVDDQKNIHDPNLLLSRAEEFFNSTPYAEAILARMNTNAAPWKTIVSIKPTVVLVVPSDLGKAQNGWRLLTNHTFRSISHSRTGSYDCGSAVFYNKGMHWFSPELKQQPKEVLFSTNGSAEITLPDGKLELQLDGEICRILRK